MSIAPFHKGKIALLSFLSILFTVQGCNMLTNTETDTEKDPNSNCKQWTDSKLKMAILTKEARKVQELIDAGADVNVCGFSYQYSTPLMFTAAQNGMQDVINVLIDAGAKINQQDSDGLTALFYAAASTDSVQHMETLLSAGAKIDLRDNRGRSVLTVAIYAGNADAINYLIDEKGMALAPGDILQARDLATLQLVLAHGGNINAADLDGVTPLLKAARDLDYRRVKFLIDQGVNVEQTDLFGNNILAITGRSLYTETVNAHFQKKLRSSGLKAGLYASVIAELEQFFNYILSIEAVNENADSLDLFFVTDLSLLRDLIENHGFNADVREPGNLLFTASRKADLDMAKYLIGKGLSPRIKGRANATIFHKIRVNPAQIGVADEQKILEYMRYFATLSADQRLSANELSLSSASLYGAELDPRTHQYLKVRSLVAYFAHYGYTNVVNYLKNDLGAR